MNDLVGKRVYDKVNEQEATVTRVTRCFDGDVLHIRFDDGYEMAQWPRNVEEVGASEQAFRASGRINDEDYVATDVTTAEEFMRRYYKPERFYTDDPYLAGRPERLIARAEEDVATKGYTFITRHDCINGRCTYFFGS